MLVKNFKSSVKLFFFKWLTKIEYEIQSGSNTNQIVQMSMVVEKVKLMDDHVENETGELAMKNKEMTNEFWTGILLQMYKS